MQKVYVISKCISEDDLCDNTYYFKFKGSYKGQYINIISVTINNFTIEVGDEYLLLLENIKCIDQVLYANVISIKRLFATFPH